MSSLGRTWLWLVFGFLYLPMAVLVAYSFNTSPYGTDWDQLGWQWYRNL